MAPSKAQQEENKLDRSGPWGKLKVYPNALGQDSSPEHLTMILLA